MTSKRTLVVGDIHGGFKALLQVLNRANATVDDNLIFLGDYVDGWSESPQLLDFLIELNGTHQCIILCGNHDDLFLDWLKTGRKDEKWILHGGDTTIKAYENISSEKRQLHIRFIESMRDHYLDESNHLFLHAGFTHIKGVESEYFPKMFLWDRSLWEMALALNPNLAVDQDRYPARLKLYSEIFIGHTPTTRIGETTPVNAANVWNLDTGAAFGGPLTILNVETKQYWQSDPVSSLYPTETLRPMW